jgi:glycosyltransferase involved in cell wall biosynthesis
MLRLTFSDDMQHRDFVHMRHLMEALRDHPESAHVDGSDGADFAIYGRMGRRRPGAAKMGNADHSFRIWRQDPQTAIADIGRDALLDPAQFALLESIPDAKSFIGGFLKGNLRSLGQEWPPGTVATDMDKFDYLGTVREPWDQGVLQQLNHAKWLWLPMSVPGEIFHATGSEDRPVDAFWLGALTWFYPLRMKMTGRLPHMGINYQQAPLKTLDVPFLKRAKKDPSLWDKHQRWYADQLRQAKAMCLCGSIFNYPVQKYFESMACGCLVLAPVPRNANLLGFKDGETMVEVNTENWEDRLRYFLDHEDERRFITDNALDLVRRRFTCEASAGHLIKKLASVMDGADVETLPLYPGEDK